MSFLKELEKKREALKKTGAPREDVKLEEMIVKDEADYFRLMKETYFERYYSLIEEFTFKSVIIPLTMEDIQALHDAHRIFLTQGDDRDIDLGAVKAKIEEGITKVRKKTMEDSRVFVRLSSRSPKDAIYHLARFPGLYQDKLELLQDQEDILCKLHAFYQASTEVLAVSEPGQAAELLTKSERIQGDLEVCLSNKEPMSLVVRQFVSFPVKNELRGFVYEGVLTALTQYNNLAFFPEHMEGKGEVEGKVRSFMAGFIRALETTLTSFIVDLVLDDEGKVWAVEVNPFGELAGSCLFGWSKDRSG